MKRIIRAAVALVLAVSLCFLTGCLVVAVPRNTKLEPFEMDWGIPQEEAEELLKCVYCTNDRKPDTVFVAGGDNNGTLEAFGTTPSLIIYSFNVTKAGSDTPGLGEVTVCFPKDDYDKVLSYLDRKCGKRHFDDPQWGTKNANVYLFEDGIINIEYSSSPMADPSTVKADERDRYVALSGIAYDSRHMLASNYRESFYMLWMYSTAETDFVKVDNTK